MKVVTATQMKELDRLTITQGHIPDLTLMEAAGAGVVACMEEAFGSLAAKRVTVFCGKGHNGGDGLVVARLLKKKRAQVQVLLLSKPSDLTGAPKTMYRRLMQVAGKSTVNSPFSPERARALLSSSHLIVDALLGTGLSSPVTGPYQAAIEVMNSSGLPVVAVDLPSGIHADSGAVLGSAVQAVLTVTFGLPKVGLYVGPGIDHAGTVRIVDIGIPPRLAETVPSPISLMTLDEAHGFLPLRKPSSHKGTFGHAGIIAGSVGKTGAAALAAKAALRVGTGLVTVATPASANPTLEAKLLEAMTVPMPETKDKTLARDGLDRLVAFANARSAVAIGPGLSTNPETVELVHALLAKVKKPLVLDADALNALAGRTAALSTCQVPPILTPHPGEMARLDGKATPPSIHADRIGTAHRFAKGRGVIVVLKGARTVVAHPDGRVAICSTGNPGMATAGTGDVLTGMLVGLLAQGLGQWEAACAGTFYHGLAGDLAATALGQAGMTAGDLVDRIPHALTQTVT